MHLYIITAAAGLISGPALVSAKTHARRGVECYFNLLAESSETCKSLASCWGISVDDFININPGVTCSNLKAGKLYCVVGEYTPDEPTTSLTQPEPPTPTTSTTQPPTTIRTSTTTTSAPDPGVSPIMPGTAANCDRYYKVESGDSCEVVASNVQLQPLLQGCLGRLV
ncbi:hypothetical protein INS49_007483 [Diaporthe citri]|uniref:uncharacterized protein n=1 Tax=Diaporthe citri TaxID=83186 RepID=UPI001C811024|nr:uncharacterized protein INS49_007483 [Diaporthe citri]KAG6353401.1 hypothetical protein INS49_007483 [Diaporthe citri]